MKNMEMGTMDKKLSLSGSNKVIAGVCGGIAEYFRVDATFIRILWVLFTLLSWGPPGVIVYVVCWAVMPMPLPEDED